MRTKTCSSKTIFSVLASEYLLIFHENKRNLTIVIASMSDIKNIKMHVFIESEYVFFNGIMCFS